MDKNGRTKLASRLTTSPHQMVQKAEDNPRTLESTHSRSAGIGKPRTLPLVGTEQALCLLLVERNELSLPGIVRGDLGVPDVEPEGVQAQPGFLLGPRDQLVAAQMLELEERVGLRE